MQKFLYHLVSLNPLNDDQKQSIHESQKAYHDFFTSSIKFINSDLAVSHLL